MCQFASYVVSSSWCRGKPLHWLDELCCKKSFKGLAVSTFPRFALHLQPVTSVGCVVLEQGRGAAQPPLTQTCLGWGKGEERAGTSSEPFLRFPGWHWGSHWTLLHLTPCSSAGTSHVLSSGCLCPPKSPQICISSKLPKLAKHLSFLDPGELCPWPRSAKLTHKAHSQGCTRGAAPFYYPPRAVLTLNTNRSTVCFNQKLSQRSRHPWDQPQLPFLRLPCFSFQTKPSKQGCPKTDFEGKSPFQKEQTFPLNSWVPFETSSW